MTASQANRFSGLGKVEIGSALICCLKIIFQFVDFIDSQLLQFVNGLPNFLLQLGRNVFEFVK